VSEFSAPEEYTRMSSRKSTRRRFIGASAAAASAIALSACASAPAPAPTAAPASAGTTAPAAAPTTAAAAPPKGAKTVGAINIATWNETGMRDATLAYNQEMRDKGIQVALEDTATGWEQKVLSMIKDKSLTWSAHGYAPFFNQYSYIKSGLAAPIDDYIKQSPVPWAKDMKSYFYAPNIDDVNKFEGKYYFIPMKLNIHMLGYRADYLQQIGIDKPPATWDDFERVLMEIKKAFASKNVWPMFMRREFYRTLGTSYVTRKGDFYDDKGVIKLDTPEFYDTINMYNRFLKNGLFNLGDLADDTTIWEKGKVFCGIDSHSWIRLAKKVWGTASVAGALTPQPAVTDKPRTWMHIDSGFIFPNAPSPQEGTDWLLTCLGPEGAPAQRWWSGVITFSGSPVHKTMFDKVLAKNPDYPEIAASYAAIPNSTILPVQIGASYNAVNTKIWTWMEQFWGGKIGDKQAVAGAVKDIEDEMSKSLLRPQ
jgi:maltose-binding protein MalE